MSLVISIEPMRNTFIEIGMPLSKTTIETVSAPMLARTHPAFFSAFESVMMEPAKGDAYLLSWDGDPRFLEQTALSLNSVYGALGKLKSKQVLVAMDACFSGTGSRSVREKGARPLVTVHLGAAQPNTTVLAAAQTDEIAQSLQDERHGIFTYYLLKGLDEGSKDSDALCAYLAPKVKEAAAHRNSSSCSRRVSPG